MRRVGDDVAASMPGVHVYIGTYTLAVVCVPQIQYDVAVVAVGEQPATFNVPGVRENCYFMKVRESAARQLEGLLRGNATVRQHAWRGSWHGSMRACVPPLPSATPLGRWCLGWAARGCRQGASACAREPCL